MDNRLLLFLAFLVQFVHASSAQTIFVRDCGQKAFPSSVPAGNYSGISHISGDYYALVSDKSVNDGYFVFRIVVDSVTGELVDVREEEFRADSLRAGDCEGIAYNPSTSTFLVCREADNSVVEYDDRGSLTGRRLDLASVYGTSTGNYGLESLAYDAESGLYWTVNESTVPADGPRASSSNGVENVLRLLAFDDSLRPVSQYAYRMDAPKADAKSDMYAMGVSEIAALGDGRLLVLEREFFVPKLKIGAFVQCKLYEVLPVAEYSLPPGSRISAGCKFLPKRLVHSFVTKLSLFGRSIANYEGMCLGPTLVDGSRVLVLVSDSQDQYAGVLKDFFRTIVLRP